METHRAEKDLIYLTARPTSLDDYCTRARASPRRAVAMGRYAAAAANPYYCAALGRYILHPHGSRQPVYSIDTWRIGTQPR